MLAAAMFWVFTVTGAAQTSVFTYQGRFTDAAVAQPTNGTYGMQFAMFDAASNGNQIGGIVHLPAVQVVNGIFTVSLDYTAASFDGSPRFLQITVGSTVLSPRQEITSAPFAIAARKALLANDSNKLGGIDANQYVTGQVVRSVNNLANNVTLAAGANITITPSGNTLTIAATGGGTGSGNFIQNQNSAVQSANFNVGGSGTVGGFLSGGVVSTDLFYRIGTQIILSTPNPTSVAVGQSAGFNATGGSNAFFGAQSGNANTNGTRNSYFGFQSGQIGANAADNSFFGYQAGKANTGAGNTFIGSQAGNVNTTGGDNTYVGFDSGSVGSSNTSIGSNSGGNGDGNTFVGKGAGGDGNSNTAVGNGARIERFSSSSPLPNNATAIGAGAVAKFSDDIVIGTNNNFVQIPGQLKVDGTVIADSLRASDLTITGGLVKLTTLIQATATGNQPLCRNANSFVSLCLNLQDNFGEASKPLNLQIEAQAAQIKAQNVLIEKQAEQFKQQQAQIEALKQILCRMNPAAQICGE